MTDSGRLVRIRLNGVSVIGRNTQGVKLIDCSSDEKVIGAVRVVEQQVDDVEGMDGSDEDFASDEETGDEA